tara:strand:- start:68 stop:472 length:405 start_codon:yes stop_codon:yes gene_type:complete
MTIDTKICPNCKEDVSLQEIKDNFNLCYKCNSDLSDFKELKNFTKSNKKVTNELKDSNTESRKSTHVSPSSKSKISLSGVFILISGLCSLFSILIISTVDFSDWYRFSELLRFLGISGIISLCIGGILLIQHKD